MLFTISCIDSLFYFQKSGYRVKEFFKTSPAKIWLSHLAAALICFSVLQIMRVWMINYAYGYIAVALMQVGVIIFSVAKSHSPPIKFTKRLIRLIILLAVVNICIEIALICLCTLKKNFLEFFCLMQILQIIMMPFCGWLIAPYERRFADKFITSAKKKLTIIRPKVIAITGSFGKTSVKNILATILSSKYRVCASPKNFNTPSGLCITVNNHLSETDEILIVEMGARYKGDIKELCEIVQPDISVITGIGSQHLATFGNIERLKSTKYEIITYMNKCGEAFFGESARELYRRALSQSFCADVDEKCDERFHYVLDNNSKHYIGFQDVCSTTSGTTFQLYKGEDVRMCNCALLGLHNLTNVQLACEIASSLGLTVDEIVDAIAKIEPIEHRLQLMPTKNGVTVIDDSYNGSLEGMRAASQVLSDFEQTKIVITPGVIEAGKSQKEINRQIGNMFGTVADVMWFYGVNAQVLISGAKEAGRLESDIHTVATRDEAVEQSVRVVTPKVIIFCNDLPI